MKLTSICIILALLASSALSGPPSERAFPSIWNDKEDGRARTDRSYHIQAEIRLFESNQSFIVDEYASATSEEFRFEARELPSGPVESLLYKRRSGEMFAFRPFHCRLVQNPAEALPVKLASLFPHYPDQPIPTGIGALWLHASRSEGRKLRPAAPQGSSIRNEGGKNDVLRNYDRFLVPPSENFALGSAFFLYNFGLDPSVLSASEHVAAIESGPWNYEETAMRTTAHFRLVQVESPFEGAGEMATFEVPLGFGCERSLEGASYTPPLSYLSDELPQVLELEAITMLPVGLKAARRSERWKSHSTLVRILSGQLGPASLHPNRYLVLETSEYAGNNSSLAPKGVKRSLQRLKQVWDFGSPGKLDERARLGEASSLNFVLDEGTGSCLGYEEHHMDHDEDFSSQIRLSASGSTSSPEGVDQTSPVLNLNSGLLKSLLSSNFYEFHFLGESTIMNQFEHLTHRYAYERRESEFKIKDKTGDLLWSGPASLILLKAYKNFRSSGLRSNRGEPTTSLIIQLYSSGLDKIIARIQVNVLESRLVEGAYLHRELDLGACYHQLRRLPEPKNGLGASVSLSRDQAELRGLELELGYQLDSAELAKLLMRDQETEVLLYNSFLNSLLLASKQRLDPTCVSRIQASVSQEQELRISALLVDKPLLLDFRRLADHRLADSASSITREYKESENECAESCVRFNCASFGHCPQLKLCQISGPAQTGAGSAKLEARSGCSVFSRRTSSGGSSMGGAELVRELRRLVQSSRAEEIALELMKGAKIVPTFVRAGRQTSEDLSDLTGSQQQDREGDVDEKELKVLVKGEYSEVEKNRAFLTRLERSGSLFPVGEAEQMEYKDCEELCKQMDCNSFAYCRMERTCLVSQLRGEFLTHSEESEMCSIFAWDHLSKFAKTLEAPRESISELEGATAAEGARSARDCASKCLAESGGRKCRSFLHCEQPPGCFLRKRHAAELGRLAPAGNTTNLCHLYQRSYLAEFDKFYERALADSKQEPNNYITITVLLTGRAELCAAECAERMCAGFQVCRKERQATCGLWLSRAGAKWEERRVKLEDLSEEAHCTSFVATVDSELLRGQPSAGGDGVEDFDRASGESGEVASTGAQAFVVAILLAFLSFAFGCSLALAANKLLSRGDV